MHFNLINFKFQVMSRGEKAKPIIKKTVQKHQAPSILRRRLIAQKQEVSLQIKGTDPKINQKQFVILWGLKSSWHLPYDELFHSKEGLTFATSKMKQYWPLCHLMHQLFDVTNFRPMQGRKGAPKPFMKYVHAHLFLENNFWIFMWLNLDKFK